MRRQPDRGDPIGNQVYTGTLAKMRIIDGFTVRNCKMLAGARIVPAMAAADFAKRKAITRYARRFFTENSVIFSYLAQSLSQILYDTPIYQAWQTFRQNFQRNICILQFKKSMQEIMQWILQFNRHRNAKTAQIYTFRVNCAGFPSFVYA